MDNNTVDYHLVFLGARMVLAIIIIALLVPIFFRENKKRKDRALLSTKKTLKTLNLETKGKGILENIHSGRKIKISRHNLRYRYVASYGSFGIMTIRNWECCVIRIEADIYNNMLTSNLVPKPFFTLKRKGGFLKGFLDMEDSTKWIHFENSFDVKNKFGLQLSSKIRLKFKQLFISGYFRGPVSLKIFSPDKAVYPQRGKIIFDLLPKIMQDKDSLKIAMDIVVDIAKQMDEMKMGR